MNPITAIVQRNLLNYVRSKGRVFGTLFMSMFMLVMFSFLMRSSMGSVDSPMNYLISGIVLGLRVNILQILLLAAVMLIAAITFSAIGLFLATVSRNSPAFQTISSMIMMPLTFVSGAYIPTTIIPGFLLPIVYLNPLTYTTSIFRFIALRAYTLSTEELVSQGMAFLIGGFIITPLMGLLITLLIGAFFFTLCVRKFDRADFSTIKIAARMQGGGPPAR